jgi:hypothetical protein
MTHTAHIQTARRRADEIIWQRFDALLNPRLPKGSQEAFTAVILDHCKPKPVAAQNNLHLNGGGLKQLKHDAIALALRETGSITKAAKKLKVNRGVVYDYFRRKAALCVLSLAVLCLVSGAFAQRGTGSNPAAVTAAPAQTSTMFAPALSVIVPPTPKTNLFYNIGLVWDSVVNPLTTGYRIRYGTNIASGMTNFVVVSRVVTNAATATESCTVSNLAFKPTWYFQAATLYGTNQSEWSYAVQVQPPLEAVFTLSAVFPLYSSTNGVNWITNKIMTLVQTNPPGMSFFRSHLRQLDFQWTNNQLSLKPFSIP